MTEPDRRTCPWCGHAGRLFIAHKLVAKPIGDWSLAGAGIKTVASDVPVLVCRACRTESNGIIGADGAAYFDPEQGATALTDAQLDARESLLLKEV